jgi:Ala-tRNA(Pro) deacylase
MTGHAAPKALLDQLDAAGVPYELLPHRRTVTAVAEADALGIEPSHVAKTLVLTTPAGFVLAVLPASERLDLRKVRAFLDTKDVELASEASLAGAYPEFELGAVPPTGAHGDRVLVDLGVCANEYVVLEAGTHEQSLRIKSADLVAQDRAFVADLSRD